MEAITLKYKNMDSIAYWLLLLKPKWNIVVIRS